MYLDSVFASKLSRNLCRQRIYACIKEVTEANHTTVWLLQSVRTAIDEATAKRALLQSELQLVSDSIAAASGQSQSHNSNDQLEFGHHERDLVICEPEMEPQNTAEKHFPPLGVKRRRGDDLEVEICQNKNGTLVGLATTVDMRSLCIMYHIYTRIYL